MVAKTRFACGVSQKEILAQKKPPRDYVTVRSFQITVV